MNCQRCHGKGYIDAPLMMSGGNYGSIQQCCDLTKYSDEVARRINGRLRSEKTDESKARHELGLGQPGTVLEFKRK